MTTLCVCVSYQDRINNNQQQESQKSPLETLDHLLESIAFESAFVTVIETPSEVVNGANNNNNNNKNNNNNNFQINQKTDSLNRYLDNVINYNTTRKSDSDSSHSSSEHQHNSNNNFHGKMPSHQYHQQLFHHRQVTHIIDTTRNWDELLAGLMKLI